jgi:hypothetical protein
MPAQVGFDGRAVGRPRPLHYLLGASLAGCGGGLGGAVVLVIVAAVTSAVVRGEPCLRPGHGVGVAA